MRVGLQVPYFTWPGGPEALGETFAGVARRAEDAGFASFWVMDHFFQLPGLGPIDVEMLEGYSALAFAAAHTSRIKLGTMVTGVTYRNPGVLVKTATTLDVLSGGRAYLGIGAAWFEREHLGLGVPFPPLKERFERLEDALRIAKQMWSDDSGPFAGKHYQMAETICVPRPVSKPHPPILIGGRGPKKTMRLVAKYGDAVNIVGVQMNDEGVAFVGGLLEAVKGHCEREGTDYGRIEKTVLLTLMLRDEAEGRWQTATQVLGLLRKFRDIGIDQVIFNMPDVDKPETLGRVGERVIAPVAGW